AVAKKLEKLKADYFAVAYASEGIALRENQINTPILVLHPLSGNFDKIVENRLEPNIYSTFLLEKFIAFAEEKKLENYPIHIKINTGMNRVGFKPKEMDKVIHKLKNTNCIKVKSVFSHLAAS